MSKVLLENVVFFADFECPKCGTSSHSQFTDLDMYRSWDEGKPTGTHAQVMCNHCDQFITIEVVR